MAQFNEKKRAFCHIGDEVPETKKMKLSSVEEKEFEEEQTTNVFHPCMMDVWMLIHEQLDNDSLVKLSRTNSTMNDVFMFHGAIKRSLVYDYVSIRKNEEGLEIDAPGLENYGKATGHFKSKEINKISIGEEVDETDMDKLEKKLEEAGIDHVQWVDFITDSCYEKMNGFIQKYKVKKVTAYGKNVPHGFLTDMVTSKLDFLVCYEWMSTEHLLDSCVPFVYLPEVYCTLLDMKDIVMKWIKGQLPIDRWTLAINFAPTVHEIAEVLGIPMVKSSEVKKENLPESRPIATISDTEEEVFILRNDGQCIGIREDSNLLTFRAVDFDAFWNHPEFEPW